MPTPLEVADSALAAHTKHIGGMVNELGGIHDKVGAAFIHQYEVGYQAGYRKAIDDSNSAIDYFRVQRDAVYLANLKLRAENEALKAQQESPITVFEIRSLQGPRVLP